MLESEYFQWASKLADVYLEVLGDNVSAIQKEAVQALIEKTTKYYQEHSIHLVRVIFEKKLEMAFTIRTKEELKQLLNPSEPYFNGKEFRPKNSKFHVPEEEAFQWFMASLLGPPPHHVVERYLDLLEQIMPGAKKMIQL